MDPLDEHKGPCAAESEAAASVAALGAAESEASASVASASGSRFKAAMSSYHKKYATTQTTPASKPKDPSQNRIKCGECGVLYSKVVHQLWIYKWISKGQESIAWEHHVNVPGARIQQLNALKKDLLNNKGCTHC